MPGARPSRPQVRARRPRSGVQTHTALTRSCAMRLCRYQHNGSVEVALYHEDKIISLNRVADELKIRVPTAMSTNLLDYLPPNGKSAKAALEVETAFGKLAPAEQRRLSRPLKEARLRVPIPDPK